METKARTKLPPVVEKKGNVTSDRFDFDVSKAKRKGTKIKPSASFTIGGHGDGFRGKEVLPVLKQKFAVVQASKECSFPTLNLRKKAEDSSALDKNLEDSRMLVEKSEKGRRDVEGQTLQDGSVELKEAGSLLKDSANKKDNVDNIESESCLQPEDNADDMKVNHGNEMAEKNEQISKGKLEQDLDLKTDLKDLPKDEADQVKKEEESGEKSNFKQSKGQSLQETRRSKSVLSGKLDETRVRITDVNLRAHSAGVRGGS